MTNSTLTFYDFVAEIIPGSVFLVGISVLFDVGIISGILVPDTFGSLGVHLILAYVTGQLIQSMGYYLDQFYWRFWHGMPTDWPISRSKACDNKSIKGIVFDLCKVNSEEHDTKQQLKLWQQSLGSIRSMIFKSNPQGRTQVFNSLYGMFRGLFTSFFLLLVNYLVVYKVINFTALILMICCLLSIMRTHRFALKYADELFSSIMWMKTSQSLQEGKNV